MTSSRQTINSYLDESSSTNKRFIRHSTPRHEHPSESTFRIAQSSIRSILTPPPEPRYSGGNHAIAVLSAGGPQNPSVAGLQLALILCRSESQAQLLMSRDHQIEAKNLSEIFSFSFSKIDIMQITDCGYKKEKLETIIFHEHRSQVHFRDFRRVLY